MLWTIAVNNDVIMQYVMLTVLYIIATYALYAQAHDKIMRNLSVSLCCFNKNNF